VRLDALSLAARSSSANRPTNLTNDHFRDYKPFQSHSRLVQQHLPSSAFKLPGAMDDGVRINHDNLVSTFVQFHRPRFTGAEKRWVCCNDGCITPGMGAPVHCRAGVQLTDTYRLCGPWSQSSRPTLLVVERPGVVDSSKHRNRRMAIPDDLTRFPLSVSDRDFLTFDRIPGELNRSIVPLVEMWRLRDGSPVRDARWDCFRHRSFVLDGSGSRYGKSQHPGPGSQQ